MANFEAALFDIGGVLTEGYDESLFMDHLAEKLGLETADLARHLKAQQVMPRLCIGEVSEDQALSGVMSEFPSAKGIDPVRVTDDAFRLSPALVDAVTNVRSQTGIKIAIGSNTFPSSAARLRSQGLLDRFDHVYLSSEIGMKKPDPRFFEYICKDMDVAAESVLFTDDLVANVEAARKAGMTAVQLETERDLMDVLKMITG